MEPYYEAVSKCVALSSHEAVSDMKKENLELRIALGKMESYVERIEDNRKRKRMEEEEEITRKKIKEDEYLEWNKSVCKFYRNKACRHQNKASCAQGHHRPKPTL
jgi:adenylate kinase family enzyme